MRVLNVHSRIIGQPKSEIATLLKTLSSENDQMLATSKWPRMKLDSGLAVGSSGGHGPIRYYVIDYVEGESITFKFTRPAGFKGTHRFKISEAGINNCEIRHVIEMQISSVALLTWPLAIRWLHDAYIEDAFDNVENHFGAEKKTTPWNFWVRFLRSVLS